MNTLRKVAVSLTLLLLIIIPVLAGIDAFITFGARGEPGARRGVGFERYKGLSVIAPDLRNRGVNVVRNTNLLRQTGGGMFVSTAEPSPDLVNSTLSLRYTGKSRKDGNRFEVTIGSRKAYMDLYDWEAKPLVHFVDSGHHGAINVSGFYRSRVTLDDAFQGTLLGLRFIQADLLPRGVIASQRYLPRGENDKFILGAGESGELGTVSSIEAAEQSLTNLFYKVQPYNETSYSVLTDAGEKFVFSTVGDDFLVDGTFYCLFWQPQDGKVVTDQSITKQLNQSWSEIRRLNPLVVRALERAFRTTAFFRYQQKKNPANWAAFVQQVNHVDKGVKLPYVPTPRLLEPVE